MKFKILLCAILCYLDNSAGQPVDSTETKCGRKTTTRPLRSVDNPGYGSVPWNVAIFKNHRYLCSGTIIDPEFVVTVAHCMVDPETNKADNIDAFRIVAGKLKNDWNITETNQQIVKPAKVFVHEKYTGIKTKYRTDIALIKVDPPFNINYAVEPVCIDHLGNESQRELATMVGWTIEPDRSNDLKEATVSMISREQCLKRTDLMESFKSFITKDKICTINEDGDDTEIGSGGGVFYKKEEKYFLGGIVSTKQRGQNVIVLHSNAAYYYDWIRHAKDYLNTGLKDTVLSSNFW